MQRTGAAAGATAGAHGGAQIHDRLGVVCGAVGGRVAVGVGPQAFLSSRGCWGFGLGVVPDWRVDAFPLPPGTPCGYIERLAQSQTGETVEYSRTWFDPNKVRYISRLK